jgi:hypothetical protein
MIILVKLIVIDLIFIFISAYTPQIGINDSVKRPISIMNNGEPLILDEPYKAINFHYE